MARYLENIGIYPYSVENNYNVNSVIIYTLSSLLKSRDISCKEIADLLHISYRTANRYKYDSFEYTTNLNLNYVFKLLDYMSFSISLFFRIVDDFIKDKKYVVFFNGNTYNSLTEDRWLSYPFCVDSLVNLLKTRRKTVDSEELKTYTKDFNLLLSQYPYTMIRDYK